MFISLIFIIIRIFNYFFKIKKVSSINLIFFRITVFNDLKIQSLKVGKIITIKTKNFKFEKNWQGFDCLKKGEIIGYDGEEVIEAPFDQTFLIMPSIRLFVGKTAVRLAYPV